MCIHMHISMYAYIYMYAYKSYAEDLVLTHLYSLIPASDSVSSYVPCLIDSEGYVLLSLLPYPTPRIFLPPQTWGSQALRRER